MTTPCCQCNCHLLTRDPTTLTLSEVMVIGNREELTRRINAGLTLKSPEAHSVLNGSQAKGSSEMQILLLQTGTQTDLPDGGRLLIHFAIRKPELLTWMRDVGNWVIPEDLEEDEIIYTALVSNRHGPHPDAAKILLGRSPFTKKRWWRVNYRLLKWDTPHYFRTGGTEVPEPLLDWPEVYKILNCFRRGAESVADQRALQIMRSKFTEYAVWNLMNCP